MTRKIEFDYAKTLEKGMRIFWAKGYEGTSSRELLDAMGIGEGSFYNTFKSKKRAYMESLALYNATINAKRGAALVSAPNAPLGIRALFKDVLDCLDDPDAPSRLCLMAASISRDVLEDADLNKYVQAQYASFVALVAERLAFDVKEGTLNPELDPDVVAPIIVTYLQGVFRFAMLTYDRCQLEKQMNVFLCGLGLDEE